MEILGEVKKGKFIAFNPDLFSQAFRQFEGKKVAVIVKKYFKKRSNPQNDYYHGVIVPIVADYMGESKKDAHEALKALHNTRLMETEKGTVSIPQSTTKLTTQEFSDYCERCRRWAAEFLGVYIPDPNEGGYFGR